MPDSTSHPTYPGQPFNPPPPPAPVRKKHHWIWIVIVLLTVVGGLLFWRSRSHSTAEAQPAHGGRGGAGQGPTMVSTAKAQTGDIGIYVNALGIVTPLNTVSIKSRVDG